MTNPRSHIEEQGTPAAIRLKGSSLFFTGEADSIDLGPDWFDLLIRFGMPRRSAPLFYTLTVGDRISCILPLQNTDRGLFSLTTYYSSLYRPLLAPDATSDQVAALFQRAVRVHGFSAVRLHALDPTHPSFALLMTGIRSAGLKAFSFHDFVNWYLPVAGMSYQTYFASLPSRVKNTVRRQEKRFVNTLKGEIDILQDQAAVEEAVAAWGRVYGCSWKQAEPFPLFVPELIRLCARRGWLRFGLARCEGVPVAAQIWIVNGGRAAIYKLAYDENYATYSVGTILTARLMQHVIDVDKVAEVDYLIGDDGYKRDWMSHRRERVGIIAFNPRTLRGLAGIVLQALSSLRNRKLNLRHARGARGD